MLQVNLDWGLGIGNCFSLYPSFNRSISSVLKHINCFKKPGFSKKPGFLHREWKTNGLNDCEVFLSQ